MAYMNQEKKQKIATALKPILAKYGMKGSLRVHNHNSIGLTLTAGPIDFVAAMDRQRIGAALYDEDFLRKEYCFDINPYWYHEHYTGTAKQFLGEVILAMKSADWYDKSDVQSDYFHTAYYYSVAVGRYDKPYTLTK